MTDRVLDSADIDRLGQTVITLAKELWIMKDRQRVLEALLADAGILDGAAVDTHQPDAGLQKQLEAERKKFIDDVIDVLVTPPLDASQR